jgi:hypothetical protein
VKEIWKNVVGFKRYEVSSLGRVRSLPRTILRNDGCSSRHKGRMLKPSVGAAGYPRVEIRGQTVSVHSLVAKAFLGAIPVGHVVNHRDCDKTNNRLTNLEICTVKENVRHGFYNRSRRGRDGVPLLTPKEIEVILWLKKNLGTSNVAIANLFSRHESTISALVRGETWQRQK